MNGAGRSLRSNTREQQLLLEIAALSEKYTKLIEQYGVAVHNAADALEREYARMADLVRQLQAAEATVEALRAELAATQLAADTSEALRAELALVRGQLAAVTAERDGLNETALPAIALLESHRRLYDEDVAAAREERDLLQTQNSKLVEELAQARRTIAATTSRALSRQQLGSESATPIIMTLEGSIA